MTTIDELYAAHPELHSAEHDGVHRVEGRLGILGLLEPGTVGAELGVFTGLFAEAILETVRPAVLHLVDPWWLAYGDVYPNWGAYTARGTLPTRVAHEAAVTRAEAARGDCEVHVHVVHVRRLAAQPARRVARLGLSRLRRTATARRSRSFGSFATSCALTGSCSATTGGRIRRTSTTASSAPSTSSSAKACGMWFAQTSRSSGRSGRRPSTVAESVTGRRFAVA